MKRPRGRPRAFDETAVLNALTDTFWVNGFSGSSLDTLAQSASVNRPSLYAAFGDKEAMYLRSMAQVRDQMSALARKVFNPAVPLDKGLREFFAKSIEVYTSGEVTKGCLILCTGAAEATIYPSVRAVLSETIQDIDACFFARFSAASRKGEMPTNITVTTAVAIATALVHSLAIRARAGANAKQLQAIAADTINLLIK